MGIHVFISYQRADQRHAKELASALEAHGLPVFVDLKIRAGDLWDEELEGAINNAFAVVPLWTPGSVQSRWVRIEARYGLRFGVLCPAMLETAEIPLEFSDVEFADLRGWQREETDHPEWRNLLDSLFELQQTGRRTMTGSEADLCFRLGVRFLDGVCVPQNSTMAKIWLQKAALLKHDRAINLLSVLADQSPNTTD